MLAKLGRRSSWMLVALPGVGALVVLGVLLFGWTKTSRSSWLLLRGEADTILHGVSRELREAGAPADEAILRAIVEEGAPRGLLYVAIVRADGEFVAASGPPREGLTQAMALGPGESLRVGERAWAKSRPLPPPRPAPRAAEGTGGRGAMLLVHFEARLVAEVDRAVAATLLVGALEGVGLLVLSLVAHRLLRGRDEALRRLEHEQRLAALGTMSAVVAHELRNPLASLKGHAQLLAEGLDALPRQKEQAQHIVDGAWRLERLSTSLLEFVRSGDLERQDVAPAEVVRGALAEMDPGRVRLDDGQAPPSWSLDPLRMQQAVANLVENAQQAAPDAPVEVRVGRERGRLVIEVRDRGPGVPVAERERIFEPFVTTRTRGMGLGLAIARQVVSRHGGTLEVVSAEGGGACFRAEIPAPEGGARGLIAGVR